ncbi:hypothetical protein GCM10025857_53410 [Alicyclobacillus contaminans]|nr:hypothetical protein GCM10025857_53410 [Alicyclobacillus contaminans]
MHDDAEVLEHVTSETLANRLDGYLEHPTYCPHGGMIPKIDQLVHEKKEKNSVTTP